MEAADFRWGLSQLDVERRDGDSEDEAPEVN